MANRKNIDREEAIDKFVELYLRGYTTPYQLMRAVPSIAHISTAKNYLALAKKRIKELCDSASREEIFEREIFSLDYVEEILFENVNKVRNLSELTGIINSILKTKERRSELLSFNSMSELLIKNFGEKNPDCDTKNLDEEIEKGLVELERLLKRTKEPEKDDIREA